MATSASWFDQVATPGNGFYGEWVNPLQGQDFSQNLEGRDFANPSDPGYQAAIKAQPNYYAHPELAATAAADAAKATTTSNNGFLSQPFSYSLTKDQQRQWISNYLSTHGGDPSKVDYWMGKVGLGWDIPYFMGKLSHDESIPGATTPGYDKLTAPNMPLLNLSDFQHQIGAYTPPAPFSYQPYQAPAAFDPGAPFQYDPYNAPDPFTYADFDAPDPFKAPTMEEALNDPGYQFALKQGQDALERSASSRGTLLTGGTLKDLTAYGQGMATQQYDKVYGRDLGEYQQHYQELADTYDRNRGNAFQNYTTNASIGQGAYGLNFNNALGAYQTNLGARQNAYNTNANLGLGAYQTNLGAAEHSYDQMLQSGQFGYSALLNQYQLADQNAFNVWDRNRLAGLDIYNAGQDDFNNTYKYGTLGQTSSGVPDTVDPNNPTKPTNTNDLTAPQTGIDPRTGRPYVYRTT